ncbi:MAG TPA: hypothetical protein VFB92_05505 [Vicinamibacterales bacterium]|jgi:hypothetical protein|nr:hypothetical protein [Vicinamibacterales bacterium]
MQRVFVTLAAAAFFFAAGAQAIAQQDGPAQGPPAGQARPPAGQPPSPSTPASPGSPGLGQSQAATTATGELTDVDAKSKTLTVKTVAGSEMKFKYDDSTKISGSSKDAAGLATSTGRQVTIQYKRDGQSNMATSIEVQASASPSPGAPRSPGAERPGAPDSPSPSPRTPPGSPDSPGAPRSPGAPDSPSSPRP